MSNIISDEVFKTEADLILRKNRVKKSERNEIISSALIDSALNRNDYLDNLQKANKVVAVPSEAVEQAEFVAWFKRKFPDEKIIMIRNDGTRTHAEKSQQVQLGLCKGVTDLYVPSTHTWIEFKRKRGGVLSEAQREFREFVWHDCVIDSHIVANGCEDGIKKYIDLIYKPDLEEVDVVVNCEKMLCKYGYEIDEDDDGTRYATITECYLYPDNARKGLNILDEFSWCIDDDFISNLEDEVRI